MEVEIELQAGLRAEIWGAVVALGISSYPPQNRLTESSGPRGPRGLQ